MMAAAEAAAGFSRVVGRFAVGREVETLALGFDGDAQADDEIDDTPDKADPEDIEIADEEQLEEATAVARVAKSTKPKPIKRNQTVAPVRKSKPTPKRDDAHKTVVAKRTTPVQFVKQSAGELKKVVWPSASTTQQYFFVVLVFVLFVMFFVAGLDALFGWLLLLWLG